MNWYDKDFDELTVHELFKIYQLRAIVFNTEQDSTYYDPDDDDPRARHVFCMAGQRLVAYARYFTTGDHVTFGRVVIAKDYRGQGLGTPLMDHILAGIKRHFPGKEIIIHAQVQVEGYYRKFGFISYGDQFIEADRKHVHMKHPGL